MCSAYTMQLILQCKQHVTKGLSLEDKQKFTFTDIGRAAGGVIGKWSVDFSVILCNIGVCAGYTVFIATNIQVSSDVGVEATNDKTTMFLHLHAHVNVLMVSSSFPLCSPPPLLPFFALSLPSLSPPLPPLPFLFSGPSAVCLHMCKVLNTSCTCPFMTCMPSSYPY